MPHDPATLPDHTPVLVGAAQCVEHITADSGPDFSSPMDLAAQASRAALAEAGIAAERVDLVGVVRLFSDAAAAWASPFGGSDNPPESVARRIGAAPRERIYTNAGGTQPLQLMMEACQRIAQGEFAVALLCGAEAIANQRFALKNGYGADWHESFDTPLDNREYRKRFAAPQELGSGMGLPAHYYGLIENLQGQQQGQDLKAHRDYMARMMAPFSAVAAQNPYAQFPTAYTSADLAAVSRANYPIATPFTKRLVAQDAVNQSCALVVTSVAQARELGIDSSRWIFPTAYAEGEDAFLCERLDIARSEAMQRVFNHTLAMADACAADMDLIDIYSCFPCAVYAACEALDLSTEGSLPLTVTGGLPYFGGPGNNYSMHALAEMVLRLRGTEQRALVTANGGVLSKHAAVVLQTTPGAVDWATETVFTVEPGQIDTVPLIDAAKAGTVLSFTVIERRDRSPLGVILAGTEGGARFFARSEDIAVNDDMKNKSPIGRGIVTRQKEDGLYFEFAS